jgi:DNA-binding transcriptional regulator YiaG
MTATTKKRTRSGTHRRPSRKKKTSGFGQAVLASLRGWERGEAVTVRQVPLIAEPRPRNGVQIKRFRTETLGVSQAVFARLLGVSPKLVEAWESGRNTPAGPVRRLLELIERDPRAFLRHYARGAA